MEVLPPELQCMIFAWLSPKDLLNVSLLDHNRHGLIHGPNGQQLVWLPLVAKEMGTSPSSSIIQLECKDITDWKKEFIQIVTTFRWNPDDAADPPDWVVSNNGRTVSRKPLPTGRPDWCCIRATTPCRFGKYFEVHVDVTDCNLGIGVMPATETLFSWPTGVYHHNCSGYTPYSVYATVGVLLVLDGETPTSHYFIDGQYTHSRKLEAVSCNYHPAVMGYGYDIFTVSSRRPRYKPVLPERLHYL